VSPVDPPDLDSQLAREAFGDDESVAVDASEAPLVRRSGAQPAMVNRHLMAMEPDARSAAEAILRATARSRAKLQDRYVRRASSALAEERVELKQNRINAVRLVETPDGARHVAACACRWHGAQHADPELARREYDAHPCSVPDGDRIHREFVGAADKHVRSAMVPATAAERASAGVSLPGEADVAPTVSAGDEAEQRFALLELDREK